MVLAPGAKVGPYEILSPLGAGGMGEVYRAHDSKLGRFVALKILPDAFARDAVHMARFEREAKLLASLNHPNIAVIYGLEDSSEVRAIVMELVEGPTLAERIRGGEIPLSEGLEIARQIAEGLEYAHEKGVVHRDLKPANIKVSATDQVKILDFGLAKAIEVDAIASDPSTSPTLSRPETQEGIILGTAAYMSPEQAKGKPVDRRADIWAFGCVLFEELSGKPAFSGETVTDILAHVVRGEPEWSQLPANTPAPIREILQRCMQKDPRQRLQSVGEARITLGKYLVDPSATASSLDLPASHQTIQAAQSWNSRSLWGSLAASILAAVATAGVFTLLQSSHSSPDVQSIRAHIKPATISSYQYESWSAGFALSPDGRWFTYVAKTPDGKSVLWLRSLDAVEDKPLPGTEKAEFPFWSPDSRFIAFFADAKLKKIEITSTTPSVICDAPTARGGAWNREGTILFSPSRAGSLQRVPATGGTPTQVTALSTSENETSHRWPFFLPDGRHFLYQSLHGVSGRDNPINSIRIGSLDSKKTKPILNSYANAIYASGYLIFLRHDSAVAQPFDLKRLELTGEAVPIAERVAENSLTFGHFSASETGLLSYLDGSVNSQRHLTWLDRSGKKLGEVLGAGDYETPVLSPDGKKLAFVLGSGASDIWVYDFARDVKTRLTFASAGKESNAFSVWSPDGLSLVYLSYIAQKYSIRRKYLDGSGKDEVLLETSEGRTIPFSWSSDGKFLAYHQLSEGDRSIWVLPMSSENKPYLFLHSGYRPQISPDGKWLAYCSDETGKQEVFVVPFPGSGGKWQLSTEGGCQARWRKDGKELYFMDDDRRLIAVDVKSDGPIFEIGVPHALFQTHVEDPSSYGYDVTSDGQRFLCNDAPEKSTAEITLVVNWDAKLKKK